MAAAGTWTACGRGCLNMYSMNKGAAIYERVLWVDLGAVAVIYSQHPPCKKKIVHILPWLCFFSSVCLSLTGSFPSVGLD